MLRQLDTKKGCGVDGIRNTFLKRYASQIAEYSANMFSVSFRTSDLPFDWKVARVVPIHKSGDRSILSNYRPISITSSCCKIIEHILAGIVRDFLSDKNILSPFQHGFRKGMSTVTQLVSTVHELSSALDNSGLRYGRTQ